jgi:hypothetical protein
LFIEQLYLERCINLQIFKQRGEAARPHFVHAARIADHHQNNCDLVIIYFCILGFRLNSYLLRSNKYTLRFKDFCLEELKLIFKIKPITFCYLLIEFTIDLKNLKYFNLANSGVTKGQMY